MAHLAYFYYYYKLRNCYVHGMLHPAIRWLLLHVWCMIIIGLIFDYFSIKITCAFSFWPNSHSPPQLLGATFGSAACNRLGYCSDVYSLGCILYKMCFGVTPYQHIDKMQARQITKFPPFPNIILNSLFLASYYISCNGCNLPLLNNPPHRWSTMLSPHLSPSRYPPYLTRQAPFSHLKSVFPIIWLQLSVPYIMLTVTPPPRTWYRSWRRVWARTDRRGLL